MAAIFAKTLFLTDFFPAFDLRESLSSFFSSSFQAFLIATKPSSQKSYLNEYKIFLAVAEVSILVLGVLFVCLFLKPYCSN